MVRKSEFSFALYRLNVKRVIDEGLLSIMSPKRINNNDDILEILKEGVSAKYDRKVDTGKKSYVWSIRDYSYWNDPTLFGGPVALIRLARSLEFEESSIVTDGGIIPGTSISSPPPAKPLSLFFFLYRHIVAIEYNSELLQSHRWRKEAQNILLSAAGTLGYGSQLLFEPIPSHDEVMQTFTRFRKLTRLRVHLLLPNPDLQRAYKKLHDDLKKGNIREIIQDMRNPEGLSKSEDALPYSAIAMAQMGYKEGAVEMTGDIDERTNCHIKTGETAIRGKIEILKERVHGMQLVVKTKESQGILQQIKQEIDDLLGPTETQLK